MYLGSSLKNYSLYDYPKDKLWCVSYKVLGKNILGQLCSMSVFANNKIYCENKIEICEGYQPNETTRCAIGLYAASDLKTSMQYYKAYKNSCKFRDFIGEKVYQHNDEDDIVDRSVMFDYLEFDKCGFTDNDFEIIGNWVPLSWYSDLVIAEVILGGRVARHDTRIQAETMIVNRILQQCVLSG